MKWCMTILAQASVCFGFVDGHLACATFPGTVLCHTSRSSSDGSAPPAFWLLVRISEVVAPTMIIGGLLGRVYAHVLLPMAEMAAERAMRLKLERQGRTGSLTCS